MDDEDVDALLERAFRGRDGRRGETGRRFENALNDGRLSSMFAEKNASRGSAPRNALALPSGNARQRRAGAFPAFACSLALAAALVSGSLIDGRPAEAARKFEREWKREYDSLAMDILEAASEAARIRSEGESK